MRKTGILILLGCLILFSGCTDITNYNGNTQNEPFKNVFLQGHHTEVNYTWDNETLIIEDVYCKKIKGSSMNPTLFYGNIICMKEYSGQPLKEGNIIHYVVNESARLHRIITIEPEMIIVRGDNNLNQERILREQIEGILIAAIYK